MRTKALAAGIVFAALAAIFAVTNVASSEERARGAVDAPVVVELFTSQGCSSCPPADEVLSRLRQDHIRGSVIPLAYHVDYWNHLGWRDPFSAPQWSERQREYARSLRSGVYTPQVVINGRTQLVGSSEGAIRREIARQMSRGNDAQIAIDKVTRNGDSLVVEVRGRIVTTAKGATLFVVLFEDGLTTAVAHGENSGARVTNDGVVRWEAPVMQVEHDERRRTVTIPLSASWKLDHLGVAAFAQDKAHEIRGAAVQRVLRI